MNFRDWTVAKKLWLLTLFSFFVLLSAQVFNRHNTNLLTEKMLDLGHTQLPAVRYMTLADMMHDGLRAVVFRAIVSSESHDEEGFKDAQSEYAEFSKAIFEHLESIDKLDVSQQIKSEIKSAMPDVKGYVEAGDSVIHLLGQKKLSEVQAKLPEYQAAFKVLEGKFEKLGDDIENEAKENIQKSEESAEQVQRLSLILTVIGGILSLAFSTIINFNLIKTLEKIVMGLRDQRIALKNYMSKIDSTSKNLSQSTSKQASAVQQTASAVEEISSMMAKTSDGSKNLAQNSKTSLDIVNKGQSAVAKMIEETQKIQESNSEVAKAIEASNEKIQEIVRVIGEIGDKTKVINDIVFQTKLLSFNASVEAARAGEHGKGFAVVAEEVGNLAQMSGNASKEISEMLAASMKQVENIVEQNRHRIHGLMAESGNKIKSGMQVAKECENVFTEIVTKVDQVSGVGSEISHAISEQSLGLDEVNTAVNYFNESTQENAVTSEQVAGVANSLKESFIELNALMLDLEKMIRGVEARTAEENSAA